MAGRAMIPIDTVAAPLIPAIAAKIVQIITVPAASPPRRAPMNRYMVS